MHRYSAHKGLEHVYRNPGFSHLRQGAVAFHSFIHPVSQSVNKYLWNTPYSDLPWVPSSELCNPPPGHDAPRLAGLPTAGQPRLLRWEPPHGKGRLLSRCFPDAPPARGRITWGLGRPHLRESEPPGPGRGFPGDSQSLGDTAFPPVHTTTWGGLDAERNAQLREGGGLCIPSRLPGGPRPSIEAPQDPPPSPSPPLPVLTSCFLLSPSWQQGTS